jgi:GDP-L-fucose synthase
MNRQVDKNSKIYVAGHKGMVGSACLRVLKKNGYTNVFGISSKDLDLRNQNDVYQFILNEKPNIIINAAAKVGGILANKNYPYDFLIDNMLIQNNLIKSAHELNVPNFIFLGSSCIYPKYAPQPLKEKYLLTGPLEPTNESYAIAKISGVKLIEAINNQFGRSYISIMPTNLYGPFDNFDINTSHVLPSMIRKFHNAKINKTNVSLWGTGSPKREFLYVDDLAEAIVFMIENEFDGGLYNVGTGNDISISDLADCINEIVEYKGLVSWDTTKPDGTPRKLMDVSKLENLGWKAKVNLDVGIKKTYNWFKMNEESLREIKFNN